MNTKSLSSRQVRWSQELFKYYFQIDSCQNKANRAADALSYFPQRNEDEEEKLWAENTQIFHCLQFSLTNTTLSGLSVLASLSPLYQVSYLRNSRSPTALPVLELAPNQTNW